MELNSNFIIREDMTNVAVWMPLNPRDETLLQRKDGGHPRWPNYWGLFGGGIESGEGGMDALMREREEEVGKRMKLIGKPKFFASQIVEEGKGNLHRFANVNYFGVRFDGNLRNIELNEGAGFSVFDFDTLRRYNEAGFIVPPNYVAIERFYKSIKDGTF